MITSAQPRPLLAGTWRMAKRRGEASREAPRPPRLACGCPVGLPLGQIPASGFPPASAHLGARDMATLNRRPDSWGSTRAAHPPTPFSAALRQCLLPGPTTLAPAALPLCRPDRSAGSIAHLRSARRFAPSTARSEYPGGALLPERDVLCVLPVHLLTNPNGPSIGPLPPHRLIRSTAFIYLRYSNGAGLKRLTRSAPANELLVGRRF